MPVVAQQFGGEFAGSRLADESFRPAEYDGQSLAPTERAARLEMRLAAAYDLSDEVASLGAGWSGVAFNRERVAIYRLRQVNRRARPGDSEVPLIAGHVPVQLVVIVEKAQLPVRSVADLVGVLTLRQNDVLTPQVDADAFARRLGVKRFRATVAFDVPYFKFHLVAVAVTIAVIGGEITIDSMFDPAAFSGHGNSLDDVHGARCIDVDIAMKRTNLFDPQRRAKR